MSRTIGLSPKSGFTGLIESNRENILSGPLEISTPEDLCKRVCPASPTLLERESSHDLAYSVNDITVPYVTSAIELDDPFAEYQTNGLVV